MNSKRARLLAHFEAHAGTGHQQGPRSKRSGRRTAAPTPPDRFAATLPSRGRDIRAQFFNLSTSALRAHGRSIR
ncbi:hypothetical protein EOB59_25630 [Mesorhizobium sp. M7A.F.Ca.MR.176.00.0.0]|nr:hypothetical protein EOB59_25630 [Mesorhizobium sp. M7A.F.Ca.MR.176.00.0.0]